MFKALLLSIWYDLSDVKLAEALDDRASFRRFCGFSANEATPERTAFVRLPDNPGEIFADSAYRGNHFWDAVLAKGGIPRIVATGMWGRHEAETLRKLHEWKA